MKTESGALTTPGRKIILATNPHKRLTGIIVCRSIDELLYYGIFKYRKCSFYTI